jgi:formate hydrogenlyase subunit 4
MDGVDFMPERRAKPSTPEIGFFAVLTVLIHCLLVLFMPPLLLGITARTKAVFAGRKGAPFLQPYHDIIRLMQKDMVFSETTTWVFKAGPVVTLAATLTAALMIPLGNHNSPVSFTGDMLLFAYLLGLTRFFTTAAALDTGSSFEGMGAAREVTFSCLAEPALFFVLITLARLSKSLTLTGMFAYLQPSTWIWAGASMIFLSEIGRAHV